VNRVGSIPPLPSPFPSDKVALLVAWVAFHQSRAGTGKPVEFSQRTAQILLGVKSRTTINKRFRAAQDEHWLALKIPARMGRGNERNLGNRYVLGSKASRNRQRWIRFGEAVFGDEGLIRPFQSSGLLLYDAFGRDNRWLTFGLLMRRGNQWSTPPQIHDHARGLVRSPELLLNIWSDS